MRMRGFEKYHNPNTRKKMNEKCQRKTLREDDGESDIMER